MLDNYGTVNTTESEFTFRFCYKGNRWIIKAPINIPMQSCVKEYAYRLMLANKIPCQLEPALVRALTKWVEKETELWHQKHTSDLMTAFSKCNEDECNSIVSSWEETYSTEHLAYMGIEEITNEEVFSEMYRTLVHSQAFEALLSLEHTYAVQMDGLVNKRDDEIHHLQKHQSEEMERAIQHVGITTTDESVNLLAVKQLEEIQMFESERESEISALRESQKREFKEWVGSVHEDYHLPGSKSFSPTRRMNSTRANDDDAWIPQSTRLEESFTIQLGAQLKQMHNLRLLSANVLDLIHIKPLETQIAVPQRLQTALSLYSNNLSGLVLLVDSRVNSYTGIKREFARLCQMSTEFHFESLEEQLEQIRDLTTNVCRWRLNVSTKDIENVTSPEVNVINVSPRVTSLKPGDVFVTRHSNLSEVHVVFHVVTDDTTHSSEISSRHPVILALRNVLKIACLYDITTITLPLLLVHDLEEEMTMTWCMKRAELVYKCVKGFMIEMASWGNYDSRNVQFLVSKSISEVLFSNLATMLPSIFRMSNPLKVKP